MRDGDFSELLPGRQFVRLPHGRIPTFQADSFATFPGNIIPSNRFDPVTAKLIKAYPLPSGRLC
jgi:hypothetical protein